MPGSPGPAPRRWPGRSGWSRSTPTTGSASCARRWHRSRRSGPAARRSTELCHAARVSSSTELLSTTYRSLAALVTDLRPEEAWQPTGCTGWAVLDLTLHLVDDARRGLVALATPADGPTTSDAVAYWRAWQPTQAQDEDVARATRVRAGGARGVARAV